MTDDISLDEVVADALEAARRDLGMTMSDAIRTILRDWLEAHSYLPPDIPDDDDSEANGMA